VVRAVVIDDHRHEPVVDRPVDNSVHGQVALTTVRPLVAQQGLALGVPQHQQADVAVAGRVRWVNPRIGTYT
jgi:hypothetical protein